MSELIVGIDGGTQSTKVLVFTPDGTVVAQGIAPLRPMLMPTPGVAEHPDDDLWDSLRTACQAAMTQLSERRGDIVGVALCSIRFCRALLNADGTLAAPVLSWMDERVGRPHHGDAAYVTAASAYLTARLTGQIADSVANYAGIWPVDHETWDWAGDVSAFGVTREQLPRLVLPGDIVGHIAEGAAEATGLLAGLPVVATANDKAVEALGNGLLEEDQLLLSLGTYITAVRPASGRREDAAASWSNFACLPRRYLDESVGIRRGMATLSWLRDLVGTDLAARATAAGCSLENVMNTEAAQVPPGSDGLLTVLDWLAPTNEPYRRGAMVGFDARHGWPHMHRSLLEGIAMTMRRYVDAMAAGNDAAAVIVAGGGSASDLMMQIVADVFERPARRTEVVNGAGLGAAICAAVATGIHPSFEAAVEAMVATAATFNPGPASEVYRRLRPVYDKLPADLLPTLTRIRDLQL